MKPPPTLQVALLALSVALLVTACSGDSGSKYFIRPSDDWKLKEGVKPSTQQGALTEPSMDWYAEYERFPAPDRSEAVRLSGHSAEALRSELAKGAFSLRRTRVREHDGFGGTGPDKKPSVVFFELDPGYAVMTLSYELSVGDLVQWMTPLEPATEQEWVDAGGTTN